MLQLSHSTCWFPAANAVNLGCREGGEQTPPDFVDGASLAVKPQPLEGEV